MVRTSAPPSLKSFARTRPGCALKAGRSVANSKSASLAVRIIYDSHLLFSSFALEILVFEGIGSLSVRFEAHAPRDQFCILVLGQAMLCYDLIMSSIVYFFFFFERLHLLV